MESLQALTPLTDELKNSLFLKACRREATPRVPVWLMRQAGRYMKDYRALRERVSFLELCKDADLASEVTLTARETLKVDAAIIFSDILLLAEAFGLGLEYPKAGGPSITRPVGSAQDVKKLPSIDVEEELSFVYRAVRKTRENLPPDIPLIGFAGAPFTLASYMIEGGPSKDFSRTKALMRSEEKTWGLLMDKIAEATAKHLNAQIDAGAQAVQIFDSWAGVLGPEAYERYVLPWSSKLFGLLKRGAPAIHFGTRTGPFLEAFVRAGGDVISVDHRIDLAEAAKRIGPEKAIQGNLDPRVLCGPREGIRGEVRKILTSVTKRPGYIFNLGHGVLPRTPLENVVELVRAVKEESAR